MRADDAEAADRVRPSISEKGSVDEEKHCL